MPTKFLSIEFHTRFFPALLWSRLKREEKGVQMGFSPTVELTIAFAVCAVLTLAGLPAAISRKSAIGWVSGGVGAVGILALVIHSISSHREPPSYDRFLVGVFFFFAVFGISAGIFAGALHHSPGIGLFLGAVGLMAGYLLGILAGLWLQYLGWLASIVSGLAGFAAFGIFFVDLVLLAGRLF